LGCFRELRSQVGAREAGNSPIREILRFPSRIPLYNVGVSASYQVFARKYRPRTFDDVLGQDHVVRTLRNAIAQNRLAHAYLFVGPRGTGKTSTARIFAKALNCPGGPRVDFDPDDPLCVEIAEGNSLDVLEIDGASNNGVEQVRALREGVGFAPSSGQFRIYYIDEVHMLTTQAFNALLKTLEEPPAHVKFIFATTDPQKILPTIISRCQRFDLRRIPTETIAKHLRFIATEEGVELSESAAFSIARGAEGGMRDAQSMLDQLVAFCGASIEQEDVLEIFGFNSAESIAELAGQILSRDNSAALDSVHRHSEAGRDLTRLLGDLIGHYRNVLVAKVDPKAAGEELSPEVTVAVKEQAGTVEIERLLRLIDLFAETDARMKWAPNKRLHFEIGVIKAIQILGETSLDDVVALVSGAVSGAAQLPAAAFETPVSRAASPSESQPEKTVPLADAAPPGGGAAAAPPAERAPASPPAAAPETREEPAPAAAPDEAPAPTDPLSGMALWETARNNLIRRRPLLELWLEAGQFVSDGGGELVVAYSGAERLYRESITRYESEIAEEVNRLAGAALSLRIEVREDLERVVEELPEEAFQTASDGAGEAGPEGGAAGDAPSDPGKGAEPLAAPEGDPAETGDGKDPLIEAAMEIFKAKLVPKPPGK